MPDLRFQSAAAAPHRDPAPQARRGPVGARLHRAAEQERAVQEGRRPAQRPRPDPAHLLQARLRLDRPGRPARPVPLDGPLHPARARHRRRQDRDARGGGARRQLLHAAGPLRRPAAARRDAVRALGSIGADFARDTADVTDRENIQYHWIRIEDVPAIWDAARRRRARAASRRAATRRGRSSAPPSPASPRTRSSTAPRRWTRSTAATSATREFSNLPRKFKTALTGHPSHDVSPETNDIAFVGTVHPEHGPGFDLWVGGGLSTNPMLAQKLGVWIPLDEVADVWEGVASIFRDYGYRRLRSRARLKFLVADWGVEKFREVLENEYLGRAAGHAAPPRPRRSATATTSACTSRRTAASTSASRRPPAGSPAPRWSQLADLMERVRRRGRPPHAVPEDRADRRRRRTRSSALLADARRDRAVRRRPSAAGGGTRWPAPASSSASWRSSTPRTGPATWSPSSSAASPTSTRRSPSTSTAAPTPAPAPRSPTSASRASWCMTTTASRSRASRCTSAARPGCRRNFGRKLRAHKVTSAGLDDYVTAVVTNYLADRERRRVVRDLGGPRRRGAAPRRARAWRTRLMSERAVPFHCPYCGEQDLWPHEEPHGAGNAAAACAPSP